MGYMSTKAYIKKYKLDEPVRYNRKQFINDLCKEFVERVKDKNAHENYKRFSKTVTEFSSKFHSLMKVMYKYDDNIWRYIYGAFITKLRDELFPNREESIISDSILPFDVVVTKVFNSMYNGDR